VKRAVIGIVVVKMDDIALEVAAVEVIILNSGGLRVLLIDALLRLDRKICVGSCLSTLRKGGKGAEVGSSHLYSKGALGLWGIAAH